MKIYFTICPEKPNENGRRLPEIVTALKVTTQGFAKTETALQQNRNVNKIRS